MAMEELNYIKKTLDLTNDVCIEDLNKYFDDFILNSLKDNSLVLVEFFGSHKGTERNSKFIITVDKMLIIVNLKARVIEKSLKLDSCTVKKNIEEKFFEISEVKSGVFSNSVGKEIIKFDNEQDCSSFFKAIQPFAKVLN